MYFVMISGQRIPSLVGCSHPGRDGPETLPVKFLRLLATVHGLVAQFVDLPLRSVGGDREWKGQEGAFGCSLLHHEYRLSQAIRVLLESSGKNTLTGSIKKPDTRISDSSEYGT